MGDGNACQMDHHGHGGDDAEIAKALRLLGALEGDDGHGGDYHVEHQLAHAQRYFIVHKAGLAQHVAHQDDDEQVYHLLPHRQKGIQQNLRPPFFRARKVYTGKDALSRHNGCFARENSL